MILPAWLEALASTIPAPDRVAAAEAQRRLDDKTKPPGSLGRLEEIAVSLATMRGSVEFETAPRAVVVMAADHGVTRQGVSAYPQAVTAQMVRNFASGGAAINVLARQMQARTVVVDLGVAGGGPWPPGIRSLAVAPGTADMTLGPAMSEAEAERALETGARLARELAEEGVQLLATGEMGIGNTTAAAALTAVFTGRRPEEVTGPGTGLDEERLAHKVSVVKSALEKNRPVRERPLETLAKVGGLEIAGLAGLIVGAAARRRPVLLDGFITGAAALVAVSLVPGVRPFLLAAHRSREPGHAAALAELGLDPILDLGLRLGEGTGAALALPVIDAAVRILREMASFEAAGVSRRNER